MMQCPNCGAAAREYEFNGERLLNCGGCGYDGPTSSLSKAPKPPMRAVRHQEPPVRSVPCRRYALTDLGNAERFAEQHAPYVRYCWAMKTWLVWTGTNWAPDDTGHVYRLAAATVRSIYAEASEAEGSDQRRQIGDWAKTSEARTRLDALLALASSQERIAVGADQLDRNQWLFNCRNGTINIRTGRLQTHDPDDLITRCSPVHFDSDATAPTWHAFLNQIFAGDAELMRYVQRVFGMCLTGDVSEQYLFICHGDGANGKSVLLDIITYVMGEYAGQAAPHLLVSSKHAEHPTELADLQGRRLVVASETEANAPLRLQLVKRLTGDGRIKARRMRQDYFEFPRTHKLFLVTNNKPRVAELSEAVWRRLRLIPFLVTIPLEDRDPKLLERLKDEAPGILRWLVEGCRAWLRDGLGEPAAVSAATTAYREESDPLGDFLADCCELSANAWTSFKELRDVYADHCQATGAQPLGKNKFAEALSRHGCVSGRVSQQRGWHGIALASRPLDDNL